MHKYICNHGISTQNVKSIIKLQDKLRYKFWNKVNKSLTATNRIVHLNVDAKTKSLLLFLIFKQLATKYNVYDVFFRGFSPFHWGFSSIRSIEYGSSNILSNIQLLILNIYYFYKFCSLD